MAHSLIASHLDFLQLRAGTQMVKKVTVRQTGTSVSATIPRDMADRLHVGVGDTLFAIETEDGVLLTPYDPTIERAMTAYNRAAKRFRGAFRTLSR